MLAYGSARKRKKRRRPDPFLFPSTTKLLSLCKCALQEFFTFSFSRVRFAASIASVVTLTKLSEQEKNFLTFFTNVLEKKSMIYRRFSLGSVTVNQRFYEKSVPMKNS